MKKLSLVLALLGLLLGTLLIASYGAGDVIRGVLSAGWRGFAMLFGWQLVLFIPLGLAWDAIVRSRGVRRPGVFIWGRMVRDASTNCLPFSQLGGFFFGARAVTLMGIGWPLATASTVVDVTAEFLAEIAFATIGLVILLAHDPHSSIRGPLELGLAAAVLAAVLFIWLQFGAGAAFTRIGGRIASRRLGGTRQRLDLLRDELTALYRHTWHLSLGVALHLVGWIASGVSTFIAYRALGAHIPIASAIGIEALLSAIAAIAFLVPANIGVQEAGYVALGALFGFPAPLSLSVSLLRRARDLAVGVPILLAWQGLELRRLRIDAATPRGE